MVQVLVLIAFCLYNLDWAVKIATNIVKLVKTIRDPEEAKKEEPRHQRDSSPERD